MIFQNPDADNFKETSKTEINVENVTTTNNMVEVDPYSKEAIEVDERIRRITLTLKIPNNRDDFFPSTKLSFRSVMPFVMEAKVEITV